MEVEAPVLMELGHESWILDSLRVALVQVDLAGVIVAVTGDASRLLEAGDLVGTATGDTFLPLTAIEDLARTPGDAVHGWTRELPFSSRSGRALLLRVRAVAHDAGHTVLFQEISEWRRLRLERDRLLQLATIGACMPTILHELKNPLTACLTSLELLVEDADDPSLQASLHAILCELRRIPLVLDGVGAVGRSLRAPVPMAVDHAVEQACSVLASKARARGVTLLREVETLPLLPFDTATLRAILSNLIMNALDACAAGGRIVVGLRLTPDRQSLELEVRDTGQGMSEQVRQSCTELFFTTKAHGSGIGLALCREACVAAGGRLTISSEPGLGTSVRLTLPVARGAADRLRA